MLPSYVTLIQKASHLRLSALSIAEGMRTGSFRSIFKGQGIDFAGVREYLRGDDIRTIDWNVTARMSKPYVKMYEEERDLVIFVIVDRSLSMQSGTAPKSRLVCASEIAALLAFAAEKNMCPLGAVFFDGDITDSYPPKMGKNHVMAILKTLDDVPQKTATGTALSASLRGTFGLLKNRSLVIIVSDFRCADYENELAQLAQKHDVIAIMLTDKSDYELDFYSTLTFEDPETHRCQKLPAHSQHFKQQWLQFTQERIRRWRSICIKRGVIPLEISTDEDAALVLARFFAREHR